MNRVYHYKRTPLAGAPDDLSSAINDYSDWESVVIQSKDDLPTDGSLVHFHNQFLHYDGPKLIQYHSEPKNRGCMNPVEHKINDNLPTYRLVISQYHATLAEYSMCKVVRNVIRFDRPMFAVRPAERHRIGYSPSTKLVINEWFDKGYEKTAEILEALQKANGVEYDIIHNRPYAECIERKSRCSVIIDECKTGSFHRSGLEGLALGKVTICHMLPEVEKVLLKAAGSTRNPFFCCPLNQLAEWLEEWTLAPPEEVNEIGLLNRQWMEKHWHPRDIVAEFIQHYENVLAG